MEERLPRKLAAILYADVVGYSRMASEDEDATHRRLKESLDLISKTVTSHHGRVINYSGDAALAMFDAVVDAVSCAAAIQRDMVSLSQDVSEEQKIQLRIGVNLGDVIEDDGDIFGDGVNIAARLEGLAEPGGICISESVRTAIGKKMAHDYEFMGEQQVKNIEEPVRAYRMAPVLKKKTQLASAGKPNLELPDKPSIAVLPFTNMSNDPEQEYFSDGITEDIITELSRFHELFVTARNSSFVYKRHSVNVGKIGKELGVAYIIEGSVRKAGNRLRITAQLVEAQSGNHLWAERYDRVLEDIFAVQDEVVQSIVTAIPGSLDLTAHEQSRRKPPDSLSAYEYFLQGGWHWRHGGDSDLTALTAFKKAVDIDPRYALAWSWIAYCYFYMPFSNGMAVDDAADKARPAIERALSLDDNDATIQAMAAYVYMISGEHDRAKAHSDRAISLNPNASEAMLNRGVVLGWLGQPQEGREWIERAIRLDPLKDESFLETLSDNLYMQRNYEGSINTLLTWRAPPFHVYAFLAACYAQLGYKDEAAGAKEKYEAARPENYDISAYVAGNVRLCKHQQDRDHWIEGFQKAGFNTCINPHSTGK